jgi:hypothetical protein
MPRTLQVSQPDESRLASAENALSDIARQSEPLPGPEIDKAALHKRPRRSASSGLVRIVCFFCLIVILMFALNAMINAGMHRVRTSEFGVWNKILQGQINADIVISGSSRALAHYDPRIIEGATGFSTYNIGLNGSQTDMQLARLQTYLNHNRKPKLLILNFDLFSFVISHEIFDPAQYVPYLREEALYAGVRRVYPDAWKWRYLPLYGYAVEDMRFDWLIGLKALFGIQPREDHLNGYRPDDRRWTGDFERFKANNAKGWSVDVEKQGVTDFADTLRLCQAAAIPVLVVHSPEYFEVQEMARNREEILQRARDLSAEFGAEFWDYSDSSICRDRANFYNSQHLNRSGATVFSEDLGKRLVQAGFSRGNGEGEAKSTTARRLEPAARDGGKID